MTDTDSLETYDISVSLVDHTSNPEEVIARSARNCYLSTAAGQAHAAEDEFDDVMGESTIRSLFDHLLGRGHFGPFETSHATFHLEGVSRVTMAQLTRHRPVTFDIQSFRYTSPDINELHKIATGDVPLETIDKYAVVPKLAYEIGNEDWWRQKYVDEFTDYAAAMEAAEDAGLPEGRAKEDSRYLLPKGCRVNIMFTANARMLMHIADMRAAGDAQWEIRLMTEELLDLAEDVWPTAFDIYNDQLRDRKNRLAP